MANFEMYPNLSSPSVAALPQHLLGHNEKIVLLIKPSIWLVWVYCWKTMCIAMATLMMISWIENSYLTLNYGQLYKVICATLILGRFCLGILQWRSCTYLFTSQRLITISGVFNVEIFQCQLTKIQGSYMLINIFHRAIGIGHIAFTTAGTANIETIWGYCPEILQINQIVTNMLTDTPSNHSQPQQPIDN